MSSLPNEYTEVEKPFLDQLASLGWEVLELRGQDPNVPYLVDPERRSLTEVLLKDRLKKALRRVNADESGTTWLTDELVSEMATRLERIKSLKLVEANEEATDLLLSGMAVQVPGETRGRRAQFIDFDRPERNDFLAVSQFKVENPAITVGEKAIKPDITLFVNGVPVVVIEAKSPGIREPIVNAITQILRYSNQRGALDVEGAERLFHYNQLTVATSFDHARLGSITARYKHYSPWTDPYPQTREALGEILGKQPSAQELLCAGVLNKRALLDVIRYFTLFNDQAGRRIKVVPRHQQYRAVHKALERLTRGPTKAEHGEWDDRGGIIWHTQGSGKSITMMYLIRKMRSDPDLRSFKVVMVTDRRDLQKQLAETANLTGEPLTVAKNIPELVKALRTEGAGLVFGMIQKFQNTQEERSAAAQIAKNLNESERVLVMVDEAHRSHASDLHANLMASLPNCAKIGFTGTPILKGKKKRTAEIFGPFIDTYTIRESQADGATLPILYEGRTAAGVVTKSDTLNKLFDNLFKEHTEEERAQLRAKYATQERIFEAPKLIAEKAQDMLRHYVGQVLPGGFKAQIVASSRLAAVRYVAAFETAKKKLVEELEGLDEGLLGLDLDDEAIDPEEAFLIRAHPHLERVRALEFAAVISHGHNDEDVYNEWTDKAKQDARIERFKKPFPKKAGDTDGDNLAFLVVKNMLLTGFNAPVEQVLYLDRNIREHDLLQAVARVNRNREGKGYGLVVDYYGVAHHLTEVMAVYDDEDVIGALKSIADELPGLRERHRKVTGLFGDRGVTLDDTEAAALLLEDIPLRAEFQIALKDFLHSLDIVLPRPEGLPYVRDAKRLGFIQRRAANLFRDDTLNLADAEPKVRGLINRYVAAEATEVLIAPVELLSEKFDQEVAKLSSPRSKAAEMEYAARHHIRTHTFEDPAYYQSLSERLETIIQEHRDNWEEQVRALEAFIARVRQGRPADRTGLSPKTHAPFFSLLEARQSSDLDDATVLRYVNITNEIVETLRKDVPLVDFWRRPALQSTLRSKVKTFLDDEDAVPFDKLDAVADEVLQLAKALHTRLVE